MNGKTLFGAALAIFIAVFAAQSVGAAPPLPKPRGPDAIEGWCNENGGTYFPPDEDGVYQCVFDDGTVVICKDRECSVVRGLTRPPGRHTEVAELGAILAAEDTVSGKLSTLASLVQSIIANEGRLASEVAGLNICKLPDLLPLPVGAAGFDRCDGQATLHVFVKNQGGADAAASVTQVFFRTDAAGGVTEVDAPTPPLPGFTGMDLSVAIPPACFTTGDFICQFKGAVNGTFVVAELDYANNNFAGQCVGLIP